MVKKAKPIKERKRKVNLDTLAPEQADDIGFQLGKKTGEIGDKAIAEINKILEPYGLAAKFQVMYINKKTGEAVQ
jgi:hypothetical protein